ncbi:MAG: MFS transporter [Actinomycetia bacterium]|nr:MFS transporter [Actinomycetes bacterium]
MQLSVTPHRARVATTVAFATNGALAATLLARYAEVKEALGLDAGAFGLAVAGFTFGAAGAFHLPGMILRRFGSRRTTSAGTAWISVALTLAAIGVSAGNPWIFVVGLVLAGCGDAVVDVAQNAQGLRVQEAYGRSLLSSMHAGWSIGATVGGVVGTVAASADVPLVAHLAGWGIVCTALMTGSAYSFLPDKSTQQSEEHGSGRLGWHGVRLLVPLALVALAGIAVEEIGNNWSAVLLATERGVPASAAGIGLSILLASQFLGRMFGDRFIDRVGHRVALMSSLITVAAGLLVTAWAPWIAATLAGLALAGLGCAITVPLAFARADALPGLRPHAGVTWIGWSMRTASIALSPAIGGITTLTALPVAITAVASLALIAFATQAAKR